MVRTSWLDGITCTITPDGKIDIPQNDIDLAYKAVKGKYINPFEWD